MKLTINDPTKRRINVDLSGNINRSTGMAGMLTIRAKPLPAKKPFTSANLVLTNERYLSNSCISIG